MGYDAFLVSLPTYDRIDGLRKLGLAMLWIYCILCVCSICVLTVPDLGILQFCCIECWFIILMPILFVRVYGIRNQISSNLANLGKFEIINECGDEYTKLDGELLEISLTEGHRRTNKLFVTMWILMGIKLFEIAGLCIAGCCAGAGAGMRHVDCSTFSADFAAFLKYYAVFN